MPPSDRGLPKKIQLPFTLEDVIAEQDKRAGYKMRAYFKDTGAYRRELYPKHMAFVRAGATHRERLFLSANQVGKTELGAYETTCHLTGLYPDWWDGKRFDHPTRGWAAGDTGKTLRDILTVKLLGLPGLQGTGMIPSHAIERVTLRAPDTADTIEVQHVSGGTSGLVLKCHQAEARLALASGAQVPVVSVRLGDVVRRADGSVASVSQLHAYRQAAVRTLRTRQGTTVVTPNHRCHTGRGWLHSDAVRVGDTLTVAATAADGGPGTDEWRVCLTALMIGDGCTRGRTPFFTCNEPPIVDAVRQILPEGLRVVPVRQTISYKVSSVQPNHNALTESLHADGLWGVKSRDKFIPPWVFQLPRAQRVLFLRWLWSCDGTVNAKAASYCSASLRLATDVRLLLWSVGIHTTVNVRHVTCNGKPFVAYDVALTGENRLRFTEIGKLNRDATATLTPRPNGPLGEVIAIEDGQRADVVGVGVDGAHELVVDGFRTGNSYDQRRESYQGTTLDFIWLDEEPPSDIYTECLLRTMTTDGIVYMTFTPLQGWTKLLDEYTKEAETYAA